MPVTSPYSLHPIKMASASGAGTITFAKIMEPKTLPNFTYTNRNQSVDYTRPTALSPGNRVFGSLGSQEGFWDLSFTLPLVMPEDLNTMLGWYVSRPGVVLVSIDGGINRYFALWKEEGLKPFCYNLNQREFYRVEVELMIVGKAEAVNFDNTTPIT